jgi:hypothetical protein
MSVYGFHDNIQEPFCTASPNNMEPGSHTRSLSRAFQTHQEHYLKHSGVVNHLITTKENKEKQTTILNR